MMAPMSETGTEEHLKSCAKDQRSKQEHLESRINDQRPKQETSDVREPVRKGHAANWVDKKDIIWGELTTLKI